MAHVGEDDAGGSLRAPPPDMSSAAAPVRRSHRFVSKRAASRGRRRGLPPAEVRRSPGSPTVTAGLVRPRDRTSTRAISCGCGQGCAVRR